MVHLLFISEHLLFVYQEMESEKQRTTEKRIRILNVHVFIKQESVLKRDRNVVWSSGPGEGGRGDEGFGGEGRGDEGFGGNGENILDSVKRPYILGHLSISFLLDPWGNLLYVTFGSQETEEVIDGDQPLLLFC